MTMNITINGSNVLFDADDAWILRYSISVVDNGKGHLRCVFTSGELAGKYVARVLINTPPSLLVDHINRNPLDNRKENLRHACHTLNAQNSSRHSDKTTSLPKGIDKTKSGKYRVRMTIHGMRIELGQFYTVEKAVEIYEKNARLFNSGWYDGSKD